MRTVTINALHCHQSTYNMRQISLQAKKIHDPLTRQWLGDKIFAEHKFGNPTPEITRACNHALKVLNDSRRVK